MAKRRRRQEEWRCKNELWTRSINSEGISVRLFQKRSGGKFYREVRRPGLPKHRKCIETYNRDEAERTGRALLAKLLVAQHDDESAISLGVLTLGVLLQRYFRDAATFLDNAENSQKKARASAKMLLVYFKPGCDITDLSENDVVAYTRWRMAGRFVYDIDKSTGRELRTRPVRVRSAESDLILLYSALRWATTVRVGKGRRLLDRHPLQGIRRLREQNPKRPIAGWERFQRTRTAAQELTAKAEADRLSAVTPEGRACAEAARDKWIRVELFVVLLEATGRRSNSVRQLRWSDINLDAGDAEITWRGEADKKGRTSVVPIPPALVDELRMFQRKLGAVGGYVFPAQFNPSEPARRDVLPRQLLAVERYARLPKLDGGLCHPYRRKWATERKDRSIKDVAAAGGWKDTETLLTCYQHEDRETMLAVMSEPKKFNRPESVSA